MIEVIYADMSRTQKHQNLTHTRSSPIGSSAFSGETSSSPGLDPRRKKKASMPTNSTPPAMQQYRTRLEPFFIVESTDFGSATGSSARVVEVAGDSDVSGVSSSSGVSMT